MQRLRTLRNILFITIFIFYTGNLSGQIAQKFELAFNYGFIQSFENNTIDFGYENFNEKYIRDGNIGGLELFYNLSKIPIQIGYNFQIAELNSFDKDIDNENIKINNRQEQECSFISNGISIKYTITSNSMFQPFINVSPLYNFFKYKIDTLSFTLTPDNFNRDGVTPDYINITEPSFKVNFGALGIKPEVGLNIILQERFGFQIKAGYEFVFQNQTELISERLNNFTFQFGLLYRFLNRKTILND